MTIEFQITRMDMLKAYLSSLRHARRTQLVVFGTALLYAGLNLYFRYKSTGALGVNDYLISALYGLGFLLLMPLLVVLMAKTQKRVLTLKAEGIDAKMGPNESHIPWTIVKDITQVDGMVVIAGKKGGAFNVPASAFASPEQRQQFMEQAQQFLLNAPKKEAEPAAENPGS
jgi:hypothetical protein